MGAVLLSFHPKVLSAIFVATNDQCSIYLKRAEEAFQHAGGLSF
jgi:hypothetical protein